MVYSEGISDTEEEDDHNEEAKNKSTIVQINSNNFEAAKKSRVQARGSLERLVEIRRDNSSNGDSSLEIIDRK